MDARIAHLEGAYDQISHRLNSFEQRFDAIDRRFDAIDRRFDAFDHRFDAVDRRFEIVEGRFSLLEQKIDRHFLWVVGLIIVSILLPLAGRLGSH